MWQRFVNSNVIAQLTWKSRLEKPGDVQEKLLREGARKMLQEAIIQEVEEYLEKHKTAKDECGLRLAGRNEYLPEREILTGIGPISIKQPRVEDRKLRRNDQEMEGFSSKILSP
jgi:putative transposase